MDNPQLYKMFLRSYDTSGLRYRGKSENMPRNEYTLEDQVTPKKLNKDSAENYKKEGEASYFDYFARSIFGFGKQIADCLNETSQSAYNTVIQGADYVDLGNIQFVDKTPETLYRLEPIDTGLNVAPSLHVSPTSHKMISQETRMWDDLKSEVKDSSDNKLEISLVNDMEKESESEVEQGLNSDWSNDLDNGWGAEVRHDSERTSVTNAEKESVNKLERKVETNSESEIQSYVKFEEVGIILDSNTENDMAEESKIDVKQSMVESSKLEDKGDLKCDSKSDLKSDSDNKSKDNVEKIGSPLELDEPAPIFSKVIPTLQETPVKESPSPKRRAPTPKPVLQKSSEVSSISSQVSSAPVELSPAKDDYLKQAEQRIRDMLAKKGVKIPQYLMKPVPVSPLTRPLCSQNLTCALNTLKNEQLIEADLPQFPDNKVMMDSAGLKLDAALANIFGHSFLMQRTPACSILPGTSPSSLSTVSIVAPSPKKSCIPKPDLFDHVPIFPDHATTPASTPFKREDFGQRPAPPSIPAGIPRRRRPIINLAIPQKQQKKVTYAKVLINEKKSFDDVVNSGQSGFRILSKHDKNCSTVEYPSYVAPED